MDERYRFVLEAKNWVGSFSELCARYEISRDKGYKWLKRYEENGKAGLQDQSRAPKTHLNETAEDIKQEILAARRDHPKWGPKKLLKILPEERQKLWPAASTIAEILKENGLSINRKRIRRATPSTQPFADCTAPNQLWCADYKGWFRTADGSICEPLTITDANTRFLLRCQHVQYKSFEIAKGIFEAAFRENGMPEAIRTDNGTPFATTGLGGLSRLSVWWLRLGIKLERIKPGKPQQNGRHERMHQTLKLETASPPAQNLRAQQRRFSTFIYEYNYVRPHESLGMRTPGSLYVSSSKPFPERLRDMEYGSEFEVRRVGSRGEFRWGGEKIFLSYSLVDELIGLKCCDGRYWRVYYGILPIGILDSHELRLLEQREIKRFEESTAKNAIDED
jgi:transposase InsO family protein